MSLFRRLRLFLLVPLITLASIVLLAILLSLFYEKEIKQLVIERLNRHLKAEITVDDFDVSLLRHFPYASLEMKNVLMKEVSTEKQKDTLLYARRISLLFNVMSFYRKDYTIRRIFISEASAALKVRKDGSNNYEFWKSDSTGGSSDLDLSRVVLDRVRLRYDDRQLRQLYDLSIHQLVFSGSFHSEEFTMSTSGDLVVEHLELEGVDYLRSKEVAIETALDVNTRENRYVIKDTRLDLADISFTISGTVVSKKNTTMKLKIASSEAGLGSFISLLPERYIRYFEQYKTSGRFEFNAELSGEASSPDIVADFSIREGRLTPPEGDVSLDQLQLNGSFKSAALDGKGLLSVPTLNARLGAQPLKADFRIEDLSHPYLTLHAASDLNLADLKGFIALDTLESLTGTAVIDIAFEGQVSDLKEMNAEKFKSIRSSGSVRLRDAAFQLKNNPLHFDGFNGDMTLKDADIDVEDLHGKISSTDFVFNGKFGNFILFLLGSDQPAVVTAKISSSLIDLDELLTNKSEKATSDTSYKLEVDPRLIGDLQVNVRNLKFRKFKAADITGTIHLEHQVLSGRGLHFNAMQGEVNMDARIAVNRRDSVFMDYDARLMKIDIRRLFRELENFDQDVMTDQHVKGTVTADVQFRSAWNNDLEINPASVKATCDLRIDNGELNGFKPILAMSKYLRMADLNNIRFSTLHNIITISDRTIHVPEMVINSSALDLIASGTHDFDNNIDYHIQLLLADVLGKKYKNQQTEFGQIEDDGLGHTKLFLAMKGTVDNPKISYDRKAVSEKLKDDISREKATVKEILHQEFGIFRKTDSTLKKTVAPAKKKEELEIEYRP